MIIQFSDLVSMWFFFLTTILLYDFPSNTNILAIQNVMEIFKHRFYWLKRTTLFLMYLHCFEDQIMHSMNFCIQISMCIKTSFFNTRLEKAQVKRLCNYILIYVTSASVNNALGVQFLEILQHRPFLSFQHHLFWSFDQV